MTIPDILAEITPKFNQSLYQEDKTEAARVKAAGCLRCGGLLHVANYPRKARGLGAEEQGMSFRLSFCCSACRRRITPKTVRFLGCKVYTAVSLVVAEVLRWHMVKVSKTCGLIGMSVETLRRWGCWWNEPVQCSKWWKAYRALIMPPLAGRHFVGELFGRLFAKAKEVTQALQKLLTFISPLTVPGAYPSINMKHDKKTQRMGAVFGKLVN